MTEFELIESIFARQAAALATPHQVLGIGDDCALLQVSPGQQLAVSSDMLVAGRHFLPGVDPAALGHKALAVNLSDLAAMGAQPLGFTLALALPAELAADEAWLHAFSQGMLALAKTHVCPLVGGDTTAGPLNICVTVLGQIPARQALRRDGASPGDDIWVSGRLGSARLALGALRGEWELPADLAQAARQRLERPTPRLALGQALRGTATAAIDLSDGLLGDLGHILDASQLGATIRAERVPGPSLELAGRRRQLLTLAGGDDYELLFTAPATRREQIIAIGQAQDVMLSRIGKTTRQEAGLQVLDDAGQPLPLSGLESFDHFA